MRRVPAVWLPVVLLAAGLVVLGAVRVLHPPAGAAATARGRRCESASCTSAPPRRVSRPTARRVTKVLTVVEENHSLRQMKSGMPYLHWLAWRFAYASNYSGIRHPSLPNYLAIAGGDTFGVSNDRAPRSHRLRGGTVFGQALARGKAARTYAEGMPRRCARSGNARRGYAVKHNPWAYFPAEHRACARQDLPETSFRRAARANALPQVGMLIPNRCHDAHDCRLHTADSWLRSRLSVVLASRDFRNGTLMVVITADEDDKHSGLRVLTVVLHASLDGAHRVVRTPLNHYSLSRLYSEAIGARPLRHAARARRMPAAFGVAVGR